MPRTEMQHLILSLGAYPIPQKLIVSFVKDAFDEGNKPTDPGLEKGIEKFLNEFIWFSRAIVAAKNTKPISS